VHGSTFAKNDLADGGRYRNARSDEGRKMVEQAAKRGAELRLR